MKTQIIGLLNETLKGVRAITGNDVTTLSAKYIMKGILASIVEEEDKDDFINYCIIQYEIDIS